MQDGGGEQARRHSGGAHQGGEGPEGATGGGETETQRHSLWVQNESQEYALLLHGANKSMGQTK